MDKKTKLAPELYGVNALNALSNTVAGMRNVMFANQASQRLITERMDPRRFSSGLEYHLAHHTLAQKMPVDATVVDIIERYPPHSTVGRPGVWTETLVIYEDFVTRELGHLSLTPFSSYHSYFGFEYARNPILDTLRTGDALKAGTVLLDTPANHPDGAFCLGPELNIAFWTKEEGADDGITLSEEILNDCAFHTLDRRVFGFGQQNYPLNLFGDPDRPEEYKIFPDLGEPMPLDGLLTAIRTFDPYLAPVEMSRTALREPDYLFDELVFVRTTPKSRVVDIKVYHDQADDDPAQLEIYAQLHRYNDALKQFYRDILAMESRQIRRGRTKFKPPLHRLIKEAYAILADRDERGKSRVKKLYRKDPMANWTVEIVVQNTRVPILGDKFTTCYGNKGVVVAIKPRDEMPVDMAGNRAQITIDSTSIFSRSTIAALYEPYYNAYSRDVSIELRNMLGVDEPLPKAAAMRRSRAAYDNDRAQFEAVWDRLVAYYHCYSDTLSQFFRDIADQEWRIEHLAGILERGIYICYPEIGARSHVEIEEALEAGFKTVYGPVSFKTPAGDWITTKEPVRIGPTTIMMLEKIAGDSDSATSSPRVNINGILAPLIKPEKFLRPYRDTPIGASREDEGRAFVAACGVEAVAEFNDRSTNPDAHKAVIVSLLEAETPGWIECNVDRDQIPLGGSSAGKALDHFTDVWGFEIVYEPEEETGV